MTTNFENLKKAYIDRQENEKAERRFFIRHGLRPSWNPDNCKNKDAGIERFSTETRWNQYQAGEITREKAIELATKRMEKAMDKETAFKLSHLDAIAAAPDIDYISIHVEYRRSSMYGRNPAATVRTNAEIGSFHGYASGYGYDKTGAAVAEALNYSPAILKILYTLKEKALAAGISDYSKTACTHVNNTECIGYGAGYTTIPYFEGGVGLCCYESILNKAGFRMRGEYGKHEDFYTFTRDGGNK